VPGILFSGSARKRSVVPQANASARKKEAGSLRIADTWSLPGNLCWAPTRDAATE